MANTDPFFDVEIQPAHTPTGNLIKNKRIVVRTDTGDGLAVVSPDYSLITHKEVVEPFRDVIGSIGLPFKESLHLDRNGAVLNYVAECREKPNELAVGDRCGMRVIVRNSYDGSGATSVTVGALVLSCLNGMVSHRSFANIRTRHVGNAIERLLLPTRDEFLQEFEISMNFWDKLGEKQVTMEDYMTLLELMKKSGIITPIVAHEWSNATPPKNAWQFMQDVTYNLTHKREKMSQDSRIRHLSNVNKFFYERFEDAGKSVP